MMNSWSMAILICFVAPWKTSLGTQRDILAKARRLRCGWNGSTWTTLRRSLGKKLLCVCVILDQAFRTKHWQKYLSPFIELTMPATVRPEERDWDCRLRTEPSGCMVASCAHPTANRVG